MNGADVLVTLWRLGYFVALLCGYVFYDLRGVAIVVVVNAGFGVVAGLAVGVLAESATNARIDARIRKVADHA